MAQVPATTELVPLKDIRDNIVFMKDGSLRAVIEVAAINFELRSSDEQIAILQQFQNFLNAIDFPLQIVVQSRTYDINQYLDVVQKATDALTNDMLKVQAEEYLRFIRELSDISNIMAKKFYVVIPLQVSAAPKAQDIMGGLKGLFAKKKPSAVPEAAGPTEEQLQSWRTQLGQRADLVMGGLVGMGLRSHVLEQAELIALFSSLYNPQIPAKGQ